ncbi:MAG: hypothetical protein K6T90_15045 [Leptolyngbyaceae cyanobacterium HOT.MB2.61]|jgi:hypothetical protein|nr:hypothetical protein [Leptolyngbyaceae cyanobacterium HOT.MB2.61]
MTVQKPPSIWMYKPWWCQPWSIVLTGSALIGGCWLLLKVVWLTVLATIPVLIWMGFFLLVYPRLMQESGLLEELSQGDE